MKRFFLTLFVCLACTALTAVSVSAATITIRADSWAPYNDDPNSDKPGYMIEAVKLIFEAKGHQVDYQTMPWSRSLAEVGKGTYDAVVGTDEEESPDLVFPSEPFGLYKNGFFVDKSSRWQYTGPDSLLQVRLGVIDDYVYGDELDAYIETHRNSKKVFVANGDDALSKLIKMLKAGRLDVVIEDVTVMSHALNEMRLAGEIVDVGSPGEASFLYIAFSPAKESSRGYANIFDEGLAELRRSGKFQKILSRYGLQDWK